MSPNHNSLHADSIVIDAVAPLLRHKKHLNDYKQGGVTAVAPTVGGEHGAWVALKEIGGWLRTIRECEDLVLIRSAQDVRAAKNHRKLGIILHFQGTEPIEKELDFIDTYKELGVGIIQLAYNERNRIGDGCEVREDVGLSRFGRTVIERMNEVGVIIDCSHTGYRTTRDAIEMSKTPVVISHAGSAVVYPNQRNLPDDLIKAIGENGGVIGANASPHFVSEARQATLDEFLAHIDHMVQLIGPDHVALGLDYFITMEPYCNPATAKKIYEEAVASGRWSTDNYRAPPYIRPKGIETPDKLGNLTKGMQERGYADADIKKIVGENWLRVYETVWGS